MSFREIVLKRRSVRKFADRPVTEGEITAVFEAARVAPSSNNSQPWRFVIVREKGKVEELAKCGPIISSPVIGFIANAPCIIVCCAEPGALYHNAIKRLLPSDLAVIDVSIATEHIVLAAAEIGLGSCWIGWISEKKVAKLLNLPKKWKVIAMLALGWPDKPLEAHEPKRKALSEIAFDGSPEKPWCSID